MSYFGKPQMGSEVEVTTRWRDYYYYRTSDYRENAYVGRVVPGHNQMPKDSFAIIDANNQYREIALDHVISLRYRGGAVVRAGAQAKPKQVNEVRYVRGSRGDTYILTRFEGKITCNCPGSTYRGTCKHVKLFDTADKNP